MKEHGPPFEILVIGEFSTHPPLPDALHAQQPHSIDVDDFDTHLQRIRPAIELPLGSSSIRLEFGEIDDFHPDALLRRAELREWLAHGDSPPGGERPVAPSTPSAPVSDDRTLFERLIESEAGRNRPDPDSPPSARDAVDDLARRVVQPVRPDVAASEAANRAQQLIEVIDNPAFRALEGRWRGLHRCVTHIPDDSDSGVRLWCVDLNRAELATGFKAGGITNRADLPAFLGGGARTWSLIVWADEIRPQSEDLALVAALGILGSLAGAPVITGYDPSFLGLDRWSELASSALTPPTGEIGELWHGLRSGPLAPWIGLVGPRLLGRVPYGEKNEPIDPPIEESLRTWSPAALGCVELLAHSFADRGWQMTPNDQRDLEGLPVGLGTDGERIPTCEAWISERAANAVDQLGFMVLQGDRQRDRARLTRFRGIGEPTARLAGRWESG